jgi:hypothetical protein
MTTRAPSPHEIRRLAAAIQATWTPRQRWSRAGKPTRRWKVPVVPLAELAAAAVQMIGDDRAARDYAMERAASEA